MGMRMHLWLAVLFAAVITAKSQERHIRRGPIKSVPLGADIKKDLDFKCPEEFGYYAHPSDCSQYYVCVFGGALLESCTGGLMYSHELQTCDWPRNVGCEATSSNIVKQQEEIQSRKIVAQPLTTPKPQPNPVITSRGQPKITRDELQQQLFQEIDELPPAEEAENDRQQRVYRGQPSNLGPVQRDRDGFSQPQALSGRSINANVIPSSVGGKVGAFSFGTQIDQRRVALNEQQNYNNSTFDNRLIDIDFDNNFKKIERGKTKEKLVRKKREATPQVYNNTITAVTNNTNMQNNDTLLQQPLNKNRRSDSRDDDDPEGPNEFEDLDESDDSDDEELAEAETTDERGKRQIIIGRYQDRRNRYKENPRYKTNQFYSQSNENRYSRPNFDGNQNSQNFGHYRDNIIHSSTPNYISNSPNSKYYAVGEHTFKPSSPDTFDHYPLNAVTQIITKSPPISSIINNQNSFGSFSDGFFNNVPEYHIFPSQHSGFSQGSQNFQQPPRQNIKIIEQPIAHVTRAPKHRFVHETDDTYENKNNYIVQNTTPFSSTHHDTDSGDDLADEESDSENENEHSQKTFYDKPRNLNHNKNRFTAVPNPFASPNFDFDSFISKIRDSVNKGQGKKNQHLVQVIPSIEISQNANTKRPDRPKSVEYSGMSTPRPFSSSQTVVSWPAQGFEKTRVEATEPTRGHLEKAQEQVQSVLSSQKHHVYFDKPSLTFSTTTQAPQKTFSTISNYDYSTPYHKQLNYNVPKFRPPNFQDNRQLPIIQTFSNSFGFANLGSYVQNSQKPPLVVHPVVSFVTNNPPIQYSTRPPKVFTFDNSDVVTNHNGNIRYPYNQANGNMHQTSLQRPTSTMSLHFTQTAKPTVSSTPSLSTLTALHRTPVKTAESSPKRPQTLSTTTLRLRTSTTPLPNPTKKKVIPKPSPEMSDYFYDEEEETEEYFNEPPVKSQFMPSSEIRPQRPPIAQNDEEYDDEYEDEDEEENKNVKRPTLKPNPMSHPHNMKMNNLGIPVPVMMKFMYSNPSHMLRNKTMMITQLKHIRLPDGGPNTARPPKYLNQTTLRPYTVRHRLAKPTTMQMTTSNPTTMLDAVRGGNRWRKPSDENEHDIRLTKIRHDGKTNSIEPTENLVPVSFSQKTRPTAGRALYNGTQNYKPDQFDAYYALYDEDGELYKDTDYVQEYNLASPRPIVQFRGTPPPPSSNAIIGSTRRPQQDIYTARPATSNDYDEDLIQGQVNDQTDYRAPVRQSTRGEGNEIGYEPVSSIRPTVYVATSKSTTPSTTSSTYTTPQTPAQYYTEAMTPPKFTIRSTTEQSQGPKNNESTFETFSLPIPDLSKLPNSKPLDLTINISSLAKPFELTENSQKINFTSLTSSILDQGTPETTLNNNIKTSPPPRIISLTTGFSLRKNENENQHPYTLTEIKKPYYFIQTTNNEKSEPNKTSENVSNESSRRSDIIPEYLNHKLSNDGSEEEQDLSEWRQSTSHENNAYLKETSHKNPRLYLKTVIKRPAPFSKSEILNNSDNVQTKLKTEALFGNNEEKLPTSHQRMRPVNYDILRPSDRATITDRSKPIVFKPQPPVSPFAALDRLRNDKSKNKKTNNFSILRSKQQSSMVNSQNLNYSTIGDPTESTEKYATVKSTTEPYILDHLSKLLSRIAMSTVSSSKMEPSKIDSNSESSDNKEFSSTESIKSSERVVKIGYNRIPSKYYRYDHIDAKNFAPLIEVKSDFNLANDNENGASEDIILLKNGEKIFSTESVLNDHIPITENTVYLTTERENSMRNVESVFKSTTPLQKNTATSEDENDFNHITTEKPVFNWNIENESSSEISNILDVGPTDFALTKNNDQNLTNLLKVTSNPSSTMRTSPFPTRVSRVNPAIKLAASSMSFGRRSTPATSNCTDNSIHQNPYCNEINTPRTNTRGRGTAHYSTSGGAETPPVNSNRGTPPTRSRPTLKPSTSIVSKATEVIDIYQSLPSRPPALYPQPTPDKTAAKCRKDVCLLPDCNCGGKDIPGDLPVESVPQIVLLTFDDSVNDLNKVLYADLFEKGRVNPNGCPITATFYVSHEWTDYSQVQNLYATGHEMASHTISHSFGEQFSQKKWNREVSGQREILAAYGGVKLEDIRGMRAPFLSVGGNKMFKMLYDSNFTYDSSLPVYENRPPSWPYTLDYKLFHDCMIPPCPTKSYPGVWEVPMVMWQDLNGGRCSMGDACANPPEAEGVYKMLLKNFDRHYTTNRAPFGLFYHAAWFTQPHHKEGFIMFLDFINQMNDVYIITNWQALQWVRDPTPLSRLHSFQPFKCSYPDRPKKCNNPKVCNLWHKSGVRYMRTCQPCPEVYPWTGKTGIRSSRIDNEIED